MNSSLDETLGDSNPHYSRVLREKIAAREAARKAMEARKAAMVEASWCRILQAARFNLTWLWLIYLKGLLILMLAYSMHVGTKRCCSMYQQMEVRKTKAQCSTKQRVSCNL